MKIAHIPVSQQPVMASPLAPDTALCPHCGGRVILRLRKCMDGSTVYYWRHQDNRDLACNGRRHPVQS